MSTPYYQGRGRGTPRPPGYPPHHALARNHLAPNTQPPPPPLRATPYTVTTNVVSRAMRGPHDPNAPLQPAPFDDLASRFLELMKPEFRRLETTVADVVAKTDSLLEGQRQLGQDINALREDVQQFQAQLNELAQQAHGPQTVTAFRLLVKEVKALRESMQPESKSELWKTLNDLRFQMGEVWERFSDPTASASPHIIVSPLNNIPTVETLFHDMAVSAQVQTSHALADPPSPVPSSYDEEMEDVEDGIEVSQIQLPDIKPFDDHSTGADDTMVQDRDPDLQSDDKTHVVPGFSGHRELSISQPVEAASEKQSVLVVTVDGQIDAEETTAEQPPSLQATSKQGLSDKENASPVLRSTPKKDIQVAQQSSSKVPMYSAGFASPSRRLELPQFGSPWRAISPVTPLGAPRPQADQSQHSSPFAPIALPIHNEPPQPSMQPLATTPPSPAVPPISVDPDVTSSNGDEADEVDELEEESEDESTEGVVLPKEPQAPEGGDGWVIKPSGPSQSSASSKSSGEADEELVNSMIMTIDPPSSQLAPDQLSQDQEMDGEPSDMDTGADDLEEDEPASPITSLRDLSPLSALTDYPESPVLTLTTRNRLRVPTPEAQETPIAGSSSSLRQQIHESLPDLAETRSRTATPPSYPEHQPSWMGSWSPPRTPSAEKRSEPVSAPRKDPFSAAKAPPEVDFSKVRTPRSARSSGLGSGRPKFPFTSASPTRNSTSSKPQAQLTTLTRPTTSKPTAPSLQSDRSVIVISSDSDSDSVETSSISKAAPRQSETSVKVKQEVFSQANPFKAKGKQQAMSSGDSSEVEFVDPVPPKSTTKATSSTVDPPAAKAVEHSSVKAKESMQEDERDMSMALDDDAPPPQSIQFTPPPAFPTSIHASSPSGRTVKTGSLDEALKRPLETLPKPIPALSFPKKITSSSNTKKPARPTISVIDAPSGLGKPVQHPNRDDDDADLSDDYPFARARPKVSGANPTAADSSAQPSTSTKPVKMFNGKPLKAKQPGGPTRLKKRKKPVASDVSSDEANGNEQPLKKKREQMVLNESSASVPPNLAPEVPRPRPRPKVTKEASTSKGKGKMSPLPTPVERTKSQDTTKKVVDSKSMAGTSTQTRRPRQARKRGDPEWPSLPSDGDFMVDLIQCGQCDNWYHYGCVGIVTRADPRITNIFLCPPCDESDSCPGPSDNISDHCERPGCPKPPADKSEGTEETFFVSSIIGRKIVVKNGQPSHQYLVQWDGYALSDSTWEGEEQMADPQKLIEEFHQAAIEEGFDLDERDVGTVLFKVAVEAGLGD